MASGGVERGLERRQEQRKLPGEGAQRLKGGRYLWLKNPRHMDWQRWKEFAALRDSALQTARAWGYKEHAMTLWDYRSRTWARKAWLAWYRSAIRCRLEPVKRVARMVRKHLEGILTAVVQGVTNARAEGINAGIQWVKYRARGYRNRQRFRDAIYFHFGGLDVSPRASLKTPYPHKFLKRPLKLIHRQVCLAGLRRVSSNTLDEILETRRASQYSV